MLGPPSPSVCSWHVPDRENGTRLNLTGALNLEAAADAVVIRERVRGIPTTIKVEKKQPHRRDVRVTHDRHNRSNEQNDERSRYYNISLSHCSMT